MKPKTYSWASDSYVAHGWSQFPCALLIVWSFAAGGCAIEGDSACDEHQLYVRGGTFIEHRVCVCDQDAGYIFDRQKGYGCKLCADGQTAANGQCVNAQATSDASTDPDGSEDAADGSVSDAPPSGLGEPCDSTSDCAGFDAKYCVPIQNVCMVDQCATRVNRCWSGAVCCDFSLLFSGLSLCVPSDQLSQEGTCPMSGTKVEP